MQEIRQKDKGEEKWDGMNEGNEEKMAHGRAGTKTC